MGEHTFSESQLSQFAQAQRNFEDACYRQFGVPYGVVPADEFRVQRRPTAALGFLLTIAGWGVLALWIVLAVFLIGILVAGIVAGILAMAHI